MLTGLAVRLSQALGLNINRENTSKPVSYYESRTRLMWSTFILDAWVGSGVDELTFLSERDIHIPLPVAEADFVMETGTRQSNYITDPPNQQMDLEAQFVRLIYLRKAVLR